MVLKIYLKSTKLNSYNIHKEIIKKNALIDTAQIANGFFFKIKLINPDIKAKTKHRKYPAIIFSMLQTVVNIRNNKHTNPRTLKLMDTTADK